MQSRRLKKFLQCTWLPNWPLEHRLSTSRRLIYKQVGLWLTSSVKRGNGSLGKASNSSIWDSTGTIMVVALSSHCRASPRLTVITYSLYCAELSLQDSWSFTGSWFSGMKCREAHLRGCLCNLMSAHMWCDQTRTRLLYRSLCTDLISLQGVNVVGCILRGCKWHKHDEKTSNFKLNSSDIASNTHLDTLPLKKTARSKDLLMLVLLSSKELWLYNVFCLFLQLYPLCENQLKWLSVLSCFPTLLLFICSI